MRVGGELSLRDVAAPTDLDDFGRAVWTELVSLLVEAEMLDRVDLASIRAAVLQYVDHERVHRALEERDDGLEVDLAKMLAERERAIANGSELLRARRVQIAEKMSALDRQGNPKESEDVPAAELGSLIGAEERLAKATERIANLREYSRLRSLGVPVALGSTGQIVEHPLLGTKRAAASLFLRFMEQYGGTTLARTRIALGKSAGRKLDAEIDDALGKGRKRKSA